MAFDYDDNGAPVGSAGGFDYDESGTPLTAAKPAERTFGGTIKDVGISALKSAISVPEAAVGLVDIPTGGAVGNLVESAGVRFKEAKRILDEELSPAQQAANRRVEQTEGFFPTIGALLENPSVIAHGAIESLGSMGAGGVVGRGVVAAAPKIAPWIAAAIGEGSITAGSMAESTRQTTGDLTAAQSAMSVASGIGTGVLGAIGGRLAKRLGVDDVDTMLVKGIAADASEDAAVATVKKGIVRRILEGGLSEGVFEELPQSAQEQVWQNAALGKPLMEGVDKAAAQGMLVGAAMGGGGNLIGSLAPTVADIDKAPDLEAAVATAEAALAAPVEALEPNVDDWKGFNDKLYVAPTGEVMSDDQLPAYDQYRQTTIPARNAPLIADATQEAQTRLDTVQADEGTTDLEARRPKTILKRAVESIDDNELRSILANPETSAVTARAVHVELAARERAATPTAEGTGGTNELRTTMGGTTVTIPDAAPAKNNTVSEAVAILRTPVEQRVPADTMRLRNVAARIGPDAMAKIEQFVKGPFNLTRDERVATERLIASDARTAAAPAATPATLSQPATQQQLADNEAGLFSQPRKSVFRNSQLRSETGPDIKGEKVTRNMRKALALVGRITGTKVVFEFAPEDSDGAVPNRTENTIHINTAARINPMQVMGHEVTHVLKDRHAAAWAKVRDTLVATMPDKRKALDVFAADYWGGNSENLEKLAAARDIADWSATLTPEQKTQFGTSENSIEDFLLDEMVSDLGGQHWSSEKFWTDVFAKIEAEEGANARSIIERLVMSIKEMLGKFLEVVRANQQGDYGTVSAEQIEATRDAITTAYAKLIRTERRTEPDGEPHNTHRRIGTSDTHSRTGGTDSEPPAPTTERQAAGAPDTDDFDDLEAAREAALASLSPARTKRDQRLFFEVAPNPNDKVAVAAWNKRTDAEKQAVSNKVVSRIIPGLLADLQITGKVVTQLGGWMDDTNPSFALVVSRGDPLLAARAIGYVLDQEAVYALGLKSFTGAEKTGIIHIDIAGKDAHKIYMQIRALDRDAISGHSTIGNEMLIGLPIDRMNELEQDIDNIARKEDVLVSLDEGYGATIKDYGYDIRNEARDSRKQRTEARYVGKWRAEARAATGPDAAGRGSDRAGAVFSSNRPSYGTVRTGTGVSAVGVHYSQAERQTLSSRFFGTGMKGEERARIMHSNDERIKRRMYFYTNEGAGITPESGVGSHAHSVLLNNLYDLDVDSDNLIRKSDPTKDWRDQPISPSLLMNYTEAAIIDAGYDGYVTHQFGRGGAVVLLGDHSVPVRYEGLGARPDVPVAEHAKPSNYKSAVARVAANKSLPSGQMSGADWKNLVPALMKGLDVSHLDDNEMYYKNQIVQKPEVDTARRSETRPVLDVLQEIERDKLTMDGEYGYNTYRSLWKEAEGLRAEYPDDTQYDIYKDLGGTGVIYGNGGYNRYSVKPDGSLAPIPASFSNKDKLAEAQAALATPVARRSESRPPSWYYSPLARAAESAAMQKAPASGWKDWLKSLPAKGVKPDEIKWSGIEEWLDAQGKMTVTKDQVNAFLSEFGVKVETILRGERNPIKREDVTQDVDATSEDDQEDIEPDVSFGNFETHEPDEHYLQERACEQFDEEVDRRVDDEWEGIADDIQRESRTQIEVALPDLMADTRRQMGDMFPVDDALVEQTARNIAMAQVAGDTWQEYGDENEDEAVLIDRAFAVLSGDAEALEAEARRRARAEIDDTELMNELTDRERQYHYDDIDSPATRTITVTVGDDEYEFVHNASYGEHYVSYNGHEVRLSRNNHRTDDADIQHYILQYLIEEQDVSFSRQAEYDDSGFVPTRWSGYATDERRAVSGSYREIQLTLPVGAFGQPKTTSHSGVEYNYYDNDNMLIGATMSEDVAKRKAEELGGRYERYEAHVETERDPSAKDFQHTTHWQELNVIGHARFDEHIDEDGKRVMVLQEIQGDWGQQRREGLENQEKAEKLLEQIDAKRQEVADARTVLADLLPNSAEWSNNIWNNIEALGSRNIDVATASSDVHVAADKLMRLTTEIRDLQREYNALNRDIPAPAPFIEKTTQWAGLVMKRMIAHAVEYGFDKVVWTSGAQQVERWASGLRQRVDTIAWEKTPEGIHIVASQNGRERANTNYAESALSDAIGKIMAQRIVADPNQSGEITGDDITISDTGMAGFYDKMLPNIANEILKKLDKTVRVKEIEVHPVRKYSMRPDPDSASHWQIMQDGLELVSHPTKERAEENIAQLEASYTSREVGTQLGFEITDKIRESAAAGIPLFSERRRAAADRKADNRRAWYYSQLGAAVNDIPKKIRTGKEAAVWLQANASKLGIKKDELNWSGVLDYLQSQPTPAGVSDWLRDNGVRVKDVVLGEETPEYKRLSIELDGMEEKIAALRKAVMDGKIGAAREYGEARDRKNELFEQRKAVMGERPKYREHTLPGGSQYRELLLVIETKPAASFRSNHFPQPNIVAHLRFNTRLDADGKRVMFIEEVQSDWAQKGRKEGFDTLDAQLTPEERELRELNAKSWRGGMSQEEEERATELHNAGAAESLRAKAAKTGTTPAAPFVTDTQAWTTLALKRAIAYAVDNGFDAVAWTTGEQQNERYSLAKQVDAVAAHHNPDGTWYVQVEKDGAFMHEDVSVKESALENLIGKELAKKIVAESGTKVMRDGAPFHLYTGLDLKVGGEGMKGFYDQIVPTVARKLGATLGTVRLQTGGAAQVLLGESSVQPSFDITDEMRQQARIGMPLFSEPRRNLEAWAGDTVVRNPDGSLKRMYHGTSRDITKFRPQQADAIFLTDQPSFAGDFADLSRGWMLRNYWTWMTPEQITQAKAAATKAIRELPPGREREREMLRIDQSEGHSPYLTKQIELMMPSEANILPLYVRAENPFDFRNPAHTAAIERELGPSWSGHEFINGEMFEVAQHIGDLERGDWNAIESPQVQAYIRKNHDSFYVRERGVTNLAVFSPNQVKSASGNTGAYSREDDDIRRSEPRRAALIEELKNDPTVFWHGSPSGSLRGAKNGLHLGTYEAAKQALNARIGVPADGDWDGTREYGKTPLGYGETGYSVGSKKDVTTFASGKAMYSDGTKVDLTSKPDIVPFRVTGSMTNSRRNPHADYKANGYMSAAIKKGNAKSGYYYINDGEDSGSVSVVVPNAMHLERVETWRDIYSYSTPRSRITGQPINQTWTDPDVTDWDDMVRKMQDDKIDTKRVLRAIRDAGVAIKEKFDAYMLETNYHGRAAARVDAFADGELRKLLEDMAMRKLSMQDLDDYLWARHAPERNAANRRSNPQITDGSGMSDAQAADILAGRSVTINGRDIQLSAAALRSAAAVAGRVDAITKGTLDLLVSYGLETQQTVDTWRRTYGSYVPLKRDMESDANYSGAFGLGNGTGSGFDVRGAASKRALGSKRTAIDILANVAMQRERAITRGEKNRVSQGVYGLALSAPNGEFWIPVNPELNKRLSPAALAKAVAELVALGVNPLDAQNLATEPVQRYTDPKTGLEMQRINPQLRGRDDVLSTRINGEDRYVFFSNRKRAQEMVRGLKNLDAASVSGALQVIAPVTRWFAAVNTQFNPVFGLTNGIRDFSTGMLNLSSTPLSADRGKIAGYAWDALKGIYLDLRDHRAGRAPRSQWAQLFEQFELDGGRTGYRDMFATSADRATAIAKELEHAGKGKQWVLGGERHSAVFGWLSDYNTAVENAMRLAAYKAALDRGMSRDAAASLAKNLTVNFNKKGLAATQTGALYAFFNAAVQGTARIAETVSKDGKLTDVGQKIVYGGMMLGVMQAMMGALAGWDDDEPPQFAREKNFIIPVPGTDKYASIPMPLGFHVLPNVGRVVTEWMMSGFKDPGKRLVRLAGVVLDAFNPIGSGTLAQTLSPTIGDPIIALAENEDWTGKSIYKADFNKLHPTPGWTRTKDTASPPSKWLSYWTNYLTGGGKYEIGMLSPTPDQIDYLVGQATGGVGRELLKTAQYVSSKATGEELPIYKTPLGVGRFVGETKGQSSETSKFYRNLERIGEHKSALEEMKDARDSAALQVYLTAHPEARLVLMADRAQREVGYLRRQKRELIEKGASRERIKLMDEKITTLTRRYNEMLMSR